MALLVFSPARPHCPQLTLRPETVTWRMDMAWRGEKGVGKRGRNGRISSRLGRLHGDFRLASLNFLENEHSLTFILIAQGK